ncbi:hypothetical protein CEXT_43511 [Caerostris extrusa]|uniref:Uncharacterized protein n=1 Tax=Caerostris extrusa TaxID=172846 RepID=A0AAV4NR83_CAEEX|nr:hypothetical protein CEXT_43511 [Caerostris extrusa]
MHATAEYRLLHQVLVMIHLGHVQVDRPLKNQGENTFTKIDAKQESPKTKITGPTHGSAIRAPLKMYLCRSRLILVGSPGIKGHPLLPSYLVVK